MRLKLTLAYDGAAYAGWQIQENTAQNTVQGAVEAALFALLRTPIRIYGAGRTDSGVHALGQVCHCDVPEKDWDWRARLNAVLPADIRLREAKRVSAGFHARKDAIAKTYFYQFWLEPDCVNPLLRGMAWQAGRLDVGAMRSGLEKFAGARDFASFQNSGTPVNTTVRNIAAIRLEALPDPFIPGSGSPLLRLYITGDGFLKQMVRNIAGFLAAIGRHKLAWGDLDAIFAARDRRCLPSQTAPARGLFLADVKYGE